MADIEEMVISARKTKAEAKAIVEKMKANLAETQRISVAQSYLAGIRKWNFYT